MDVPLAGFFEEMAILSSLACTCCSFCAVNFFNKMIAYDDALSNILSLRMSWFT